MKEPEPSETAPSSQETGQSTPQVAVASAREYQVWFGRAGAEEGSADPSLSVLSEDVQMDESRN